MDDTKRIKQIALLSVLLSIIILGLKFAAYWHTSSISMLSDAMESFVNIASTSLAYIVISIAAIPADKNHPYGHDKAEYFACGVEGTLIALAGIGIFIYASQKLVIGHQVGHINSGLYIAILAAILNGVIAKILFWAGEKYNSVALKANAQHILVDIWTTVFVVVSLVIIKYFPWADWIDPIMAICLSIYILYTGYRLIAQAVNGLMDVALPDDEIIIIENIIKQSCPDNCDTSNLRSKFLGKKCFVDFKLLVDGAMTVSASHYICDRIEDNIEKRFANSIVIIHVEPKSNN